MGPRDPMLVAFTFRAKKGKELEFERLLRDPESGRRVAQGLGATRNVLFLKDGAMIRVLEFPDAGPKATLADLAKADPGMRDFLRRIGPLIEGGFDMDKPESLDAFNRRISFLAAYDVRP